jgi:hypothetical protein
MCVYYHLHCTLHSALRTCCWRHVLHERSPLLLLLLLLSLSLLWSLLQSRGKASDNNLVRFKPNYLPPEGLKFSMDFNVSGNVDTRDSILAAAAGSGSADIDDDDDDNDEQQWQRSWDLSLLQQAVLVIKRAGATGFTGSELKVLFGLNRKECDKVSVALAVVVTIVTQTVDNCWPEGCIQNEWLTVIAFYAAAVR